MIYEYALEPELVATWGNLHNHRFFSHTFGLGQGRIVSRYPKSWAKIVWDSFSDGSDMDRKRLEELLARLKETMVKRKECYWDETKGNWLENALQENARHPFYAIMARNNPNASPYILSEADLAGDPVGKWNVPHGRVVLRKASDMATAIEMILLRCRWVKFIDPRILSNRANYWHSFKAFFNLLGKDRPLDPPEQIEIHALFDEREATMEYLRKKFESIIPSGLSVTILRWKEILGGQMLHNRFILTDLGGVFFGHGLDAGVDGDTDDITLLDREQYELRCAQYDCNTSAFDLAESPIQIIGTK